ncbi:hypothetical protein NLG97_g1649 [Lecanicillium saksenae]|uniref:Uncharacterized protein n=1 Tax=Lecanicillium saksenae TaxID=468837 RepID=A0ACC1R4J6_9HYPO|nr:hypothetical protein NLG97_g1649 [Lecanicillium saksenae]
MGKDGLSDCTQACVADAGKKYNCKAGDKTCFCSHYDQIAGDTSFAVCMLGCSFDEILTLADQCSSVEQDSSGPSSSGSGDSGSIDGLFPSSSGSGGSPTSSSSAPKSSTSASSSSDKNEKSGSGLSTAAIAGIGAGGGVLLILIVVGIVLCVCYRKRKQRRAAVGAPVTTDAGVAAPLVYPTPSGTPAPPTHGEMTQYKSEYPTPTGIPELHTPVPSHAGPVAAYSGVVPSPSPISNGEMSSVPPTAHSNQQIIFELPGAEAKTKADAHELA